MLLDRERECAVIEAMLALPQERAARDGGTRAAGDPRRRSAAHARNRLWVTGQQYGWLLMATAPTTVPTASRPRYSMDDRTSEHHVVSQRVTSSSRSPASIAHRKSDIGVSSASRTKSTSAIHSAADGKGRYERNAGDHLWWVIALWPTGTVSDHSPLGDLQWRLSIGSLRQPGFNSRRSRGTERAGKLPGAGRRAVTCRH